MLLQCTSPCLDTLSARCKLRDTLLAFEHMPSFAFPRLTHLSPMAVQLPAQVAEVQREFVVAMLASSHFNRILSAVRECKVLLDLGLFSKITDQGAALQVRSILHLCPPKCSHPPYLSALCTSGENREDVQLCLVPG